MTTLTAIQEQKAKDKAQALKLWGQGVAPSAIGERLKRKPSQITAWATEAGLREKGEPPRYRYDGEGGVAAHGSVITDQSGARR